MRERDEGRAAEVARLTGLFRDAGALQVEPGYLQPAETLLDLYGENIRARAYLTDDPLHGEQVLRPDFTVPVVEIHRAEGAGSARYTYAGPVWRRQEVGEPGPREFWQVGFELFDADIAAADAEVFALFCEAIGARARPVTGDLGFLFAAIEALDTSEARKAALRRHVWRPRRFERLIERFSGRAPFACDRRDWPADPYVEMAQAGEANGLRTPADVAERIETLKAEARTPPLSGAELGLLTTILGMRGNADACLDGLSALARSFPALEAPLTIMDARLGALRARGIDPAGLPFEGAFGRSTMEYYDGFTFAFRDAAGQPVATGGRYDALTRALGGSATPAVGGVIRPGLLARLG